MMTLKLDPKEASFKDVRHKLDLADADIDPDFGVVNISPEENLYTILVDERAAQRVAGHESVKGTYSNPTIEPFDDSKKSPPDPS
jgi:hypothetical protein